MLSVPRHSARAASTDCLKDRSAFRQPFPVLRLMFKILQALAKSPVFLISSIKPDFFCACWIRKYIFNLEKVSAKTGSDLL
jgi:hypothetical protein